MLKKANRIKRDSFMDVIKKGKTMHFPFFTLRFYIRPVSTNSLENKPVFAVVVPKAVAKKAVHRNLMRRKGYSAIKKSLSQVYPSVQASFFMKKEALSVPYSELEAQMTEALQKAQII